MAQTPTKCELAIKIKKAPVGPSRQAAFFGPTSLTGHCGHGWIRSLPRAVVHDPSGTGARQYCCDAIRYFDRVPFFE